MNIVWHWPWDFFNSCLYNIDQAVGYKTNFYCVWEIYATRFTRVLYCCQLVVIYVSRILFFHIIYILILKISIKLVYSIRKLILTRPYTPTPSFFSTPPPPHPHPHPPAAPDNLQQQLLLWCHSWFITLIQLLEGLTL